MRLTNPDNLVNVQELAYFEGKIGGKYIPKADKKMRVVNVSSDLSNQTTNITNGQEETIIYKNTGNAAYTITISSSYSSPDGQQVSLPCPVGGYCEVSFLNIDGTIYVRGI